MEEDEISLNVGGTIFVTFRETLNKYPHTKLGSLTESSPYYRQNKNYYFFDRNPDLFNTILDFYRNDILHFPSHVCSGLWHQELRYWGLSVSAISECCYSTYVKYSNDDIVIQNLRRALDEGREFTQGHVSLNNDESKSELDVSNPSEQTMSFRSKFWRCLSNPRSSTIAQIYNWIYFLMVFLSALLAIFHTIPELKSGERDFQTTMNKTEIYKRLRININNQKEIHMSTLEFPLWMSVLDILLALFFSVELFVRIAMCPDKKEFFKDWLNILDVILFIAICIRFIIEKNPSWSLISYDIVILYSITYSVTVFRLFRFFRLARQFSGLYVLLLALRSSLKEFLLLIFTILLFALLFASCIFYAEYREPTTFPHMLSGLWWAIITLTTVGYGDHVPKSPGGQVIGSLCAICGIIVLAMPVAMIVANFNAYYQKNKDREKFNELYDFEQKRKLVTLNNM